MVHTLKKIWVKAAPLSDPALAGMARVPKEKAPNRYITEDQAVEVDLTSYYQRCLNNGSLVVSGPQDLGSPVDSSWNDTVSLVDGGVE